DGDAIQPQECPIYFPAVNNKELGGVKNRLGVTGSPWRWIQSYLEGWSYQVSRRISACWTDIVSWMTAHHLKLNPSKTELLFIPVDASDAKIKPQKATGCDNVDNILAIVPIQVKAKKGKVMTKCISQRNCSEQPAVTGAGSNQHARVMADIQAMFHQAKVPEEDADLLQFIWWPSGDMSQDLEEYDHTSIWRNIFSQQCQFCSSTHRFNMNSAEARFAHLLQPIRDLTKNWDVDLASQLGEYLEELDQMTISFDGGKTMMNFAEAALLIQGSTCIYGRKVELLHNLVFQTLDCISNKTRRRDKQGSVQADGVTDNLAPHDERDDFEFDLMEEEPNIQNLNMRSDPSGCIVHYIIVFLQPVKIVRLPPESLIAAEAQEKQKYPLLSLKGEVLGSCKDFRINNFTLDTLGIIRLGLNSFQKEAPAWCPGDMMEFIAGGAGDVNGEDNDGGSGAEELPPLMDNGVEMELEPEEHIRRHQATGEKRMLRPRPTVQPVAEQPKQLQQTVDPWKWLDPYENIGEDKPLKTGKCCNVPAGLEESGKRKRKATSKLQDFWGWCTSAYENTERKLKNGPFHPEFNYIYLSKMSQQMKARKRVLTKTGVYISDEVLKRTYLEPEKQEDQDEVARHPDLDGEDYSDHENENLFEDHLSGNVIGDQDPIFNDSQMGRISYEDLVKKSVELFLANSQKYAQETALSRRVREWEDEINPLLLAQEDCVAFDIHDYGDRIVHALSTVGVKRSFASLVKGMENTEACRYMLASLQLANDYTVEIEKTTGLEESVDTMELTLLSKQRAHERLKTYNAPSDHDLP
ncbi:hypothetical protein P4O66_015451, partial [Electrophorus voltai]